MLLFRGALIQILDIPGIVSDAAAGKGMGRRVLSVVRNADLVLIVVDELSQIEVVRRELYNGGFRLDMRRPDVTIAKKETGGLSVNIAVKKARLDADTVRQVLGEFKIHNADVLIRENVTIEALIDSVMKNRVYVPSLVVVNKVDRMDAGSVRRLGREAVAISALKGQNIGALKDAIWAKLGLMRVFMKLPGREADMNEPLIMKRGCTVLDAAEKTLRARSKYLKYARIWGPSAKFPEQKVGPEHRLSEGDIVELHA